MLPWSGVFYGQGGKKYGIKVWVTHDNLLNTMFMSLFRLVTQPNPTQACYVIGMKVGP